MGNCIKGGPSFGDDKDSYQVQSKEMHVLNPSLGKAGSGRVPPNRIPLLACAPGPFVYTWKAEHPLCFLPAGCDSCHTLARILGLGRNNLQGNGLSSSFSCILSLLGSQDQGSESRFHSSWSTKSSSLPGHTALPLSRKNLRSAGSIFGLETSLCLYCKQLCFCRDHGMSIRGRWR